MRGKRKSKDTTDKQTDGWTSIIRAAYWNDRIIISLSLHSVLCCTERLEKANGPCVVDVEKPRDLVLDVTVRDDVTDHGDDIIVIDSVYDAGVADRLLR